MTDHVTRRDVAPLAVVPRTPGALGELLDRVYEHNVVEVERWVRRLVGPDQDVEDIVHDVFLIAIRRRGEFRGDASLKTWLFRIADHVVKGRRRRDRVRRWLFLRHAEDSQQNRGAVVTPLQEVEQREQTARLYAALDRLPHDYRTALILYEIEGLSGEQVAELAGVPLGTLWVRLHRGRAKLLAELSRELPTKEMP